MTTPRFFIEAIACALAVVLVWLPIMTKAAYPHPATSISGDPLGWSWPRECCNSAATSPTGDCAVIDSRYVTEGPDGYRINIPKGGHPKLLTKGYAGIVPYGQERDSPSGEYGICLSTDGNHRFCFFAGAKGY